MSSALKPWSFDLKPDSGEVPKGIARPLGFNPGATLDDDDAGVPNASAQAELKRKSGNLTITVILAVVLCVATVQHCNAVRSERSMEIAIGPGRSLLMNAFMMYMSGGGIHIFSIMITFMGISTPCKAIISVNKAFRSVDDGSISLVLPKLIYTALNLLGVAVALWKMARMGLLPVTAADWTSYLVPRYSLEHSGVPLEM